MKLIFNFCLQLKRWKRLSKGEETKTNGFKAEKLRIESNLYKVKKPCHLLLLNQASDLPLAGAGRGWRRRETEVCYCGDAKTLALAMS